MREILQYLQLGAIIQKVRLDFRAIPRGFQLTPKSPGWQIALRLMATSSRLRTTAYLHARGCCLPVSTGDAWGRATSLLDGCQGANFNRNSKHDHLCRVGTGLFEDMKARPIGTWVGALLMLGQKR